MEAGNRGGWGWVGGWVNTGSGVIGWVAIGVWLRVGEGGRDGALACRGCGIVGLKDCEWVGKLPWAGGFWLVVVLWLIGGR